MFFLFDFPLIYGKSLFITVVVVFVVVYFSFVPCLSRSFVYFNTENQNNWEILNGKDLLWFYTNEY